MHLRKPRRCGYHAVGPYDRLSIGKFAGNLEGGLREDGYTCAFIL